MGNTAVTVLSFLELSTDDTASTAVPLTPVHGRGIALSQRTATIPSQGTGGRLLLGTDTCDRIVPVNESAQASLAEWLKLHGRPPKLREPVAAANRRS